MMIEIIGSHPPIDALDAWNMAHNEMIAEQITREDVSGWVAWEKNHLKHLEKKASKDVMNMGSIAKLTIKSSLRVLASELPSPYDNLFLVRCIEAGKDIHARTGKDLFTNMAFRGNSFYWGDTKEDYQFWSEVINAYRDKSPYPKMEVKSTDDAYSLPRHVTKSAKTVAGRDVVAKLKVRATPKKDKVAEDEIAYEKQLKLNDQIFLNWLHDRLIYEYGENIDTDFVHRFRKIINKMS